MIGLAAQTVCASAASATCNCWNPRTTRACTRRHTHSQRGGHTLTQLGRARTTGPRAPCHIPCGSRGPHPGMPLELVLFVPWPFPSCVHLVVPRVVLAPQHTGCGKACSFGSPAPPVPRLSVPLSAAPGHLHAPRGDGGVIGAEGEHGDFKCPVLFVANPLPPPPHPRHMQPPGTYTHQQEAELLLPGAPCQRGRWACVSAAEGPQLGSKQVCIFGGQDILSFTPLLNAGPADKAHLPLYCLGSYVHEILLVPSGPSAIGG